MKFETKESCFVHHNRQRDNFKAVGLHFYKSCFYNRMTERTKKIQSAKDEEGNEDDEQFEVMSGVRKESLVSVLQKVGQGTRGEVKKFQILAQHIKELFTFYLVIHS